MTDIYDQRDKAFANVSAFVLVKGNERVGTIAFKFPRDGAGRLYCYLHVLGLEMIRGAASGYGYDKRSAAAFAAARKLDLTPKRNGVPLENAESLAIARVVKDAIKDAGHDWRHDLEAAGFAVWQAV